MICSSGVHPTSGIDYLEKVNDKKKKYYSIVDPVMVLPEK
jgi:hypothetical protein